MKSLLCLQWKQQGIIIRGACDLDGFTNCKATNAKDEEAATDIKLG